MVKEYYFLTPNFISIVSNKHHFVNADCIRLTPMNTVNHNQLIFTYTAKTTLSKTIIPTITLKYVFSILIIFKIKLIFQ